jgi:SAM-dependent methyltransferase
VNPSVKRFVKSRLPRLFDCWRKMKEPSRARRSAKQTFTRKFHRHSAQEMESLSGPGSDLAQTETVRRLLPSLVKKLECRTLLDVPCGDFYWMRLVDLSVDYIGADVVDELIRQNQKAYGNARRRFIQRDLLQDPLPTADLVLCRDCLVHFSNGDVMRALANIRRSGATWLLATTFVSRDRNEDIPTGKWRAVNLQRPPFNLPVPVELFDEAHPSIDFDDKHLALWRVADLPDMPVS